MESNDIALIRLKDPAKLNQKNIKTICLPLEKETIKEDGDYVILGWGATENETKSSILRKGILPPVDYGECQRIYSKNGFKVSKTQICAGAKGLYNFYVNNFYI